MRKPTTKWKNYLMTMSTSPQASWSLRTDNVNPCDTTPLPHRQPIRELCTSWSQNPVTPSPHLAFTNALPKPFGELEAFQGKNQLISLHGLAINLSLLQTPTFQFVWPHRASGAWICVNNRTWKFKKKEKENLHSNPDFVPS